MVLVKSERYWVGLKWRVTLHSLPSSARVATLHPRLKVCSPGILRMVLQPVRICYFVRTFLT